MYKTAFNVKKKTKTTTLFMYNVIVCFIYIISIENIVVTIIVHVTINVFIRLIKISEK